MALLLVVVHRQGFGDLIIKIGEGHSSWFCS
jgi:hypothetical protein